ncbi:MAG: DinB family protein [Planctomycetota bacterium]|jgi:uncharacterized damage-inducible protein DinB
MADTTKEILLLQLDGAFGGRAFQGTTLTGALRGVTPEVATFRASAKTHSIWELVLHTAYWKYVVRRHLVEEPVPKFPRSPSNFPRVPNEATAAAFKRDRELLTSEHELLRAAVAAFDVRRLPDQPTRRSPTYAQLIVGVAAHDTHHTGQIQLLKRLHADG